MKRPTHNSRAKRNDKSGWTRFFSSASRRGATMVEGAIIMVVFLTLIFGMLDLSIAVSRYNMLSQAARQGAREAIVRGSLAPPLKTAWGPTTYNGTAAGRHEIAQIIRPSLVGIDPSTVNIVATWPDGANTELMRVRIALSLNHQLLFTAIFTNQEITLTASSTMYIAH